MSVKKKTAKAREVIVAFLQANPTRSRMTVDEFCGGRSPIRSGYLEPPTPYNGAELRREDVQRVMQDLQTEGILGRPIDMRGTMRDVAYPRNLPVLRIP